MLARRILVIAVLFFSCLVSSGKDKKKILLPADVLKARTVFVMVDPGAGMEVQDPNANRIAQVDVEQALAKWGRLDTVTEPSTADLIITVRKGHSRAVQPTIGTPINKNSPVIFQPTDSGLHGAGRTGNSQIPGDPTSGQSSSSDPHPQLEVGPTQDTFVVYRASLSDHPLDAPPVWRYTAKDALASPGVPAVEVFRKLIADAEKQQAGTP